MSNVSVNNEKVDWKLAFFVARALDILNKRSEKQGRIPQENRWLFAELAKVFADSLVGLDFAFHDAAGSLEQLDIFLFIQKMLGWKSFGEEDMKRPLETTKTTLEHFASGTEHKISQTEMEKTKKYLEILCDFLLEKAKAHVGSNKDGD